MNLQLITNEMLVEKYGDRHDGISIYKGSRRVGYLTDLRISYAKESKKKVKQKEYNTKATEARRDAMPEAVNEMKVFLENHLSKFNAEVFINETQPNVHINDCKCYIIVDPIYGKHRLGIQHSSLDANDMASLVDEFPISSSTAKHHVLWNSLSRDDIVEVIIKLCSK
ncbi:inhibitor of host transcription [Citrobacter phage CkP1]|nr:inhibitor of host transcription [Citrobacter phage CkP1]